MPDETCDVSTLLDMPSLNVSICPDPKALTMPAAHAGIVSLYMREPLYPHVVTLSLFMFALKIGCCGTMTT